MMEKLIARGEQLASQAQAQMTERAAQQLRMLFGSAAVDVEDAQVFVRGKDLIRRWLVDPALRFLSGGLK